MNLNSKINTIIRNFERIYKFIPGVVTVERIDTHQVLFTTQKNNRKVTTLADICKNEIAGIKINEFINKNNNDYFSFFYEYKDSRRRIRICLMCMRILMRDYLNKPFAVMTVSLPVDQKHCIHENINHLLGINHIYSYNKSKFEKLTSSEKEILKLCALGYQSTKIAAELGLKLSTVQTHRRNIRKKMEIKNHYDLIKLAEAFDMI